MAISRLTTVLLAPAVLLVGALTMSACGSTSAPADAGAASPAAAAELSGTSWVLESYAGPDGEPVAAVTDGRDGHPGLRRRRLLRRIDRLQPHRRHLHAGRVVPDVRVRADDPQGLRGPRRRAGGGDRRRPAAGRVVHAGGQPGPAGRGGSDPADVRAGAVDAGRHVVAGHRDQQRQGGRRQPGRDREGHSRVRRRRHGQRLGRLQHLQRPVHDVGHRPAHDRHRSPRP